MNIELKQQWVKALRDPSSRKCLGQLWKPTPEGPAFCAMGLLCELTPGIERVPYGYKTPGNKYEYWFTALERLAGLPFDKIVRLIGISESGATLSEIAEWVEENV